METAHRTHVCRLTNHSQVREAFDRHTWSASTLWNVANSHAQHVCDDTGEIPDEAALRHELKHLRKYDGLHSQSSQKVLEGVSGADSSWFGCDDDRDNPPGYRKQNYYDADGNRVHKEHLGSTVTWKSSAIRHDTDNNRLRLS